jgi:hypothetical protein
MTRQNGEESRDVPETAPANAWKKGDHLCFLRQYQLGQVQRVAQPGNRIAALSLKASQSFRQDSPDSAAFLGPCRRQVNPGLSQNAKRQRQPLAF